MDINLQQEGINKGRNRIREGGEEEADEQSRERVYLKSETGERGDLS